MSAPCSRAVWLPLLLTAVFAASYLVPTPPSLFELHLERISVIGAPVFLVFQQLTGIFDSLPMPYTIQQALSSALLVFLALCWFTFILLPFWSDYRLRGLSLRHTQLLFALFGVVITAVAWVGLGGWRVHDA